MSSFNVQRALSFPGIQRGTPHGGLHICSQVPQSDSQIQINLYSLCQLQVHCCARCKIILRSIIRALKETPCLLDAYSPKCIPKVYLFIRLSLVFIDPLLWTRIS